MKNSVIEDEQGRIHGQTDGWIDGWRDGETDGRMDGLTKWGVESSSTQLKMA